MSEELLQKQITELNQKVDLLLEYVTEQRQKSQILEDLVDDVSRVGNDLVKSSVKELDDYGLEFDPEEVKLLIFRLLRNIGTFNNLLSLLENGADFVKDVSPLVKEMIIDLTQELDRMEESGIIQSLKTISANAMNPAVLNTLAHASVVLSNTKMDEQLDNKSLFKIIRELNSPEVRKSLSFGIRILKEISK